MKNLKKSHIVLIAVSILILLGCIGMTVLLLFSNYQNVRLFKQAKNNFLRGDEAALALAETQLLQITAQDSDNEAAFIMLAEIASRKKIYPEQVYYRFMAHRLNPLSSENKEKYIESLCFARYFDRLEHLLAHESSLSERHDQLLLYAAGRNGNINKYKNQFSRQYKDDRIAELAFLLFKPNKLTDAQKLAELGKISSEKDAFLEQEILVAETDLYLTAQKIDAAEKSLLQAYELNNYAFAPALGRFYSDYRNFGKAVAIFEKHLAVYHDQTVAIQLAEIYCLLKQTDKIIKLRTDYQADSGSRAMLCSYYFDALIALNQNNMTALKELTAPLRNTVNTPLAAFIFFCADAQESDPATVLASYNALQAHRPYLDLQERADNILLEYLKKSFAANSATPEKLLPLATALYQRKPDIFTAKFILLTQKRSNSINIVLLKDALKRFGNDQGVIKLAIEYYLKNEPVEAEKLIGAYKKNFASQAGDMLRYELALYTQKKDYRKISALFRQNFKPEIRSAYWAFASFTMREDDLHFLSSDKLYAPFCQALLLIRKGDKKSACDLLEKADHQGNQALLFFAAKTLAENGRNRAALARYRMFPENSPYRVTVLLNMAELFAESGDLTNALGSARQAYDLAPQDVETQFCYADKLHKQGKLSMIPEVVKISTSPNHRRRLEKLWVAGMEQRIRECNVNTQREKVRELCRQLLVVAPDNNTAIEYLKTLNQMRQ